MSAPPVARARHRTWPQRVVVVLGCLVVMACLGTAWVAAYVGVRYGQIDRISDIDLRPLAAGEPANFLVVGTDSRAGIEPDGADAAAFLGDPGCDCTDTIMVVRVDPEEKQAYVLSLPRDLYLPISGTGKTQRINTAHQHGVQTLIDTIQDNFDIPIHHYVEIDFVGFEKLVDAVGGIPLWFDAPVRDRKTGLRVEEAECQVLDGEQARMFVRSRYIEYLGEDGEWHADPTADLGRITRQQVFIRRAIAKAVGKGLSNPATLNELVSAGVANVTLDELLDARDLIDMGSTFADFDPDDLVGYSFPSDPMTTSAGAQVELPEMREGASVLSVFRGLPPGTIAPESVEVTVLNGTDVTGQAADVAGALGAIGFHVVEFASNDDGDVARTTVRYGYGRVKHAELVARHITGGASLEYDPSLNGRDAGVVVVTGADFTTIHSQPAPEGSPDHKRITTTTLPPSSTTTGADGAEAEPTPGTTSTTVVGYSTGEPPDGVACG
jgi:LCP family protein required for cell wall assembly